jgi:hypothetical protein
MNIATHFDFCLGREIKLVAPTGGQGFERMEKNALVQYIARQQCLAVITF